MGIINGMLYTYDYPYILCITETKNIFKNSIIFIVYSLYFLYISKSQSLLL